MDVMSAVILVIMMLILGNTIAMGVRERTSEYGVLRAIGFLPRHITMWIVGESFALGLLGGVWGLLLAWPIINLGFSRFVEENMGGFFPYFRLETANMLLGLSLAALLGVGASMIPAWRASKIRVVDAVRRVA
jgi:putative ABC transport system permease protein